MLYFYTGKWAKHVILSSPNKNSMLQINLSYFFCNRSMGYAKENERERGYNEKKKEKKDSAVLKIKDGERERVCER